MPQQVQMLSSSTQQLIETNNNQPLIDTSQKRRLSRASENNFDGKTQMENYTKPINDTHYIKNKALQSPVGRYKVRVTFHGHNCSLTNEYVIIISFLRSFPQELEEKASKDRDQVISSTLTHSNSELNSICPHKGSTKSEFW